ncbi:MAG: ribosome silencing factor [Nitrospirae bacterium]|nr:ribosome silencing factor [Nitrospirota bacterium]
MEKLKAIVEAASEKKAKDTEVLHLTGLTIMTDYFVICSGESTTQVRTIVDYIEEQLRKAGVKPSGIEGYSHSKWVLMDYGDVIVHVFEEETRQYYEIEKLWIDAPRIEVGL